MSKETRILSLAIIALWLSLNNAHAGDVEDHAPIGVMGDHMHKAGEWMTSYRYMHMDMPGNYNGSGSMSVDDFFTNTSFMVAPLKMTMEMHMVGAMYGVTDELTAMVMIPYVIKDMEHRRKSDRRQFGTHTQGIGDIRLSGMYSLKEMIEQPVHLNFGFSLPTGSINEMDQTLLGPDRNLPYPMQLGSGTVDFLPGFTYLDKHEKWSWGFQAATTLRFGKNDRKYRLGNRYELTSWIAHTCKEWFSSSFRLKYSAWGNISGGDNRLNPAMVPTADPNLRAGERIDALLGINLLAHEGILKDHRLALEVGYPVYQHLKGPQLGVGLHGTIGWQLVF